MSQSKHVRDVVELADVHARTVKRRKGISDSELSTLADEAYWNAVFPLLENRGADTEAAIQGATLEEHYIRAFAAAYRELATPKTPPKTTPTATKATKATKAKTKAKTKANARLRPPLRGLAEPDDRKGETLRAVKRYVESGANVNELLDEGEVFMESLLHLAAANHHVAIMKYLLVHGADPDLPNGTTGERPLHAAIGAGGDDPAPLALLVDHGADVNAASLSGALPLHDAIILRRVKMVGLLLARGADPRRTIRLAKADCDAFELCARQGAGKQIKALLAKRR